MTSEIEAAVGELLAEARNAFSDPKLIFTLAAAPSCLTPAGYSLQISTCDESSPDNGQVRGNTFYWPRRSVCSIGAESLTVRGLCLGRFVFMALAHSGDGFTAFNAFSMRAAGVLLQIAPPGITFSPDIEALVVWPLYIMFFSPSARKLAVEQPTGPRLMSNPWAASLVALNELREPTKISLLPEWDPVGRRLMFDGKVCKQYAKRAEKQVQVVEAFQSTGWQPITDPERDGNLPRTVESLNKNLKLIRFHLNGDGQGVYWTVAE